LHNNNNNNNKNNNLNNLNNNFYQVNTQEVLTNLTHHCQGTLPDETHLLLLTVTQLINLHHKNITMLALIWSPHIDFNASTSTALCPDHFEYVPLPSSSSMQGNQSIHWINDLDPTGVTLRMKHNLTCVQIDTHIVSFARFTPSSWEREESYVGLTEQAQQVSHLVVNLQGINDYNAQQVQRREEEQKNGSSKPPAELLHVYLQTFLIDYGAQYTGLPQYENDDNGNDKNDDKHGEHDKDSGSSSSEQPKVNCSNSTLTPLDKTKLCNLFYQGLLNETAHVINPRQLQTNGTIVYWRKEGVCIANDSCGSIIQIGGSDCQGFFWKGLMDPSISQDICQFSVYFQVFPKIPQIYSTLDLWIYNTLTFVPFMFLWLFLAYFFGRRLHQRYMDQYYVIPPHFRIVKDEMYYIELTFTGTPHASLRGALELVSNNNNNNTQSSNENESTLNGDNVQHNNNNRNPLQMFKSIGENIMDELHVPKSHEANEEEQLGTRTSLLRNRRGGTDNNNQDNVLMKSYNSFDDSGAAQDSIHSTQAMYYNLKQAEAKIKANSNNKNNKNNKNNNEEEGDTKEEVKVEEEEEEEESYKRFTKATKTLITYILDVEFQDEDVPGTHTSSVKHTFRFNNKGQEEHSSVSFVLKWEGEFEVADFQAPIVQLEMYKEMPLGLNTIINLLFMPVLLFCSCVCNLPKRAKFVQYHQFIITTLYIMCVNICWILVVTYTVLMNVRFIDHWLWATAAHKPFLGILFYTIFALAQLIAVTFPMCACILPKHKKPKDNVISNEMIREFGMTKLRNAYIISSRFSRAHEAASKFKLSHVDDIEYYAMKAVPANDEAEAAEAEAALKLAQEKQ